MYPHDYHDHYHDDHHHHDDFPHMHNRGEGRPYLDPNVDAFRHDAALPVLSSIGRGPKGHGIYSVWDPETCMLKIYDDENDELKCSVVLDSPKVSISQPHDIYPGQNAEVDITVEQGDITTVYPILLPPGEPGSIIFLLNNIQSHYEQHTVSVDGYQHEIVWAARDMIGIDIVYDGYSYSSPDPRVNDTVLDGYNPYTIIAVDDHIYNDGTEQEPIYTDPIPSVLMLAPVSVM